ncbi:MAG: Fic family protein [Parachlamydiaceae bacterium]|nr:Fic family protein [Parachlamydiaceae bacterium]
MKIQQEHDAILSNMANFPNGASLEEIRKALKWPVNHVRTLQRRLATLVEEKRLIVEGVSRARRYRLPRDPATASTMSMVKKNEFGIPLSAEAESVRGLVLEPIHLRLPVGYNREFLDRYQPNKTNYLSEVTRRHLMEKGGSYGDLPAGTYARQILSRLLIDLSWNSSRLEGNTYSLLETERLLKLSEIVEGKDLKEAQMILNHKEAIEFLVYSGSGVGINRRTILNLHAILSNDLLGNPEACGRLRSIPVGIGKSVYNPLGIPQLIEECFQQIVDKASKIRDPFEQAFFLMVHLPYLQPFEDVNKRVSRLVANIPLILLNLSPLSFVDVPVQIYVQGLMGVYELNRIELLRDVFVWAYERSCLHYSVKRRELSEPDPFRIRYRELIRETVVSIVRNQMNRNTAVEFIKRSAIEAVPSEVKMRFIEVVETEIMSLHEGNYARYRLRYSEYSAWRNMWE